MADSRLGVDLGPGGRSVGWWLGWGGGQIEGGVGRVCFGGGEGGVGLVFLWKVGGVFSALDWGLGEVCRAASLLQGLLYVFTWVGDCSDSGCFFKLFTLFWY